MERSMPTLRNVDAATAAAMFDWTWGKTGGT